MIANALTYAITGIFVFFFAAGLIVSTVGALKNEKTFWVLSFSCGLIALVLARWGGI